jgi:hypothetical protein
MIVSFSICFLHINILIFLLISKRFRALIFQKILFKIFIIYKTTINLLKI